MEDRYPPNAYQGTSPAQHQNNNMNAPYVQNTPHSVSAARAANKSSSDPQSGTSPFYSGAINWMTSPNNDATKPMSTTNTGAMPYAQDKPNTGMMPSSMQSNPNSGTMGAMQDKQNTGTMPSSMQSSPNSGTMGVMQGKQNTGMMPSSVQSNPNSGTMGAMQSKKDSGMLPSSVQSNPNSGTMGAMQSKKDSGMLPSSVQSNPNSGTMGAMQGKQDSGMMPSSMQSNPNSGTMGAMQGKQDSGMMPSSMQSNPNSGTMGAMQGKQDSGMMPYAEDKPNAGVMPYSSNQSNAGTGVQSEMTECSYKMGTLPPCAPLSAGFVPWQQENSPKYSAGDALTRGTLFPGLDLPYLNMVNQDHPYAGTPLGELMALGFVIKELNLYLDTHPKDRDALMMLQSMNKLMAEGTEKYTRMYGPITISNIVSGDEFTWINNPWPWDYNERPVAE